VGKFKLMYSTAESIQCQQVLWAKGKLYA